MKLCSIYYCILITSILTSINGPALAVTYVSATFSHAATLPCERKCDGCIEWYNDTKLHPEVLARCCETSCSSHDGYHMSHEEYLRGNNSLTITTVQQSNKRSFYLCKCTNKGICEVELTMEPLISSVQKKFGEDVELELYLTEPVEMMYRNRSSSNSSGERICVVEEHLQCITDYSQRVSLNHTVIRLKEVKLSDEGVYIIRDMKTKKEILKYTLHVEKNQRSSCPVWLIVLVVLGALGIAAMLMLKCSSKVPGCRMQQHEESEQTDDALRLQRWNGSSPQAQVKENKSTPVHNEEEPGRTLWWPIHV